MSKKPSNPKWWMTVGLIHGEYATTVGEHERPTEVFAKWMSCNYMMIPELGFRFLRPCPPAVVEWIEADHSKLDVYEGCYRRKVNGGWVHCEYSGATNVMCFFPVPGTENLTLKERT